MKYKESNTMINQFYQSSGPVPFRLCNDYLINIPGHVFSVPKHGRNFK